MAQDASMPLASLRRTHPDDASGDRDLTGWNTEDRRSLPRRTTPGTQGRRPALAAVGVLIVVGCAALGATLGTRLDRRGAYIVIAAYVPQGAAIVAGDLGVVRLTSTTGLTAIPSVDEASVLRRRASEPLEPGSLLVPGDLGAGVRWPAGDALVGTSLASDQAPGGLAPGASVIVVMSGPSGSSATPVNGSGPGATNGSELAMGTVVAITAPSANNGADSSDGEIVTLEVPKSTAAEVTAASAAGDVSLAEISAGSGS
jgi:hypothetical protein